MLLYRLPIARTYSEKRGIDPMIEVTKTSDRPDYGINITFAGGFMGILVLLLCIGIAEYSGELERADKVLMRIYFGGFTAMSLAATYFLLRRHNKYLRYFKEFDKMDRSARRKWSLISLGVVLGIPTFLVSAYYTGPH
jgi:hypothetical protein